MGQAKTRGDFEQRRKLAIELAAKLAIIKAEEERLAAIAREEKLAIARKKRQEEDAKHELRVSGAGARVAPRRHMSSTSRSSLALAAALAMCVSNTNYPNMREKK